MRAMAFLVAYMTCGGHGRRVHTRSGGVSSIPILEQVDDAVHRTLSIVGESQTDRSTARSEHAHSPLKSLVALLALERPVTAWQLAGQSCGSAKRRANSHQAVPPVVHSGRLAGSDISMQATPERTSSLDALLAGPVPDMVKELTAIDSRVDVPSSSVGRVIDAVTEYAGSNDEAGESTASMAYAALRRRGVLRAFGSYSQQNLEPMQRTVQVADQERVTGFPAEVFVTNDLAGRALELFILTGSFWLFLAAGDLLGLDPLLTSPAVAVGLVVDRFSLDGAISQKISRALRGGSRETAIKREAGRFLIAYLLGNPVQSCSLGGLNKFVTVNDPDLKKGLETGFLTRKVLERHSIVMMSGIAAEVMATGKTESGAIDEDELAATLKKDKWDQDQMESQARWGISQAVVLLKKYQPAYKKLCKALEDGASVGTAIMAIEESMVGEEQLPVQAETSMDVPAPAPIQETTQAQGVRPLANTPVITQAPEPDPAPAPAPARASMSSEDVDTRLSEVELRLAQINAKLSGKPLDADVEAQLEAKVAEMKTEAKVAEMKTEAEPAKEIEEQPAKPSSKEEELEPAKEIEEQPAKPSSKEEELAEVDAKLEAIKKRLADLDKK